MSKSSAEVDFFDEFPEEFWALLTANGKEYFKVVGVEAIKQLVLGVFIGENLRDETEFLTKRRLGLISAALLAHYVKLKDGKEIRSVLNRAASKVMQKRTPKEKKRVALWLLGLAGKTKDNVLGNNVPALTSFGDRFFDLLTALDRDVCERLGQFNAAINFSSKFNPDVSAQWNWKNMLHFMAVVGAMTLTIRGSEKSMYGKLFGNIVLGSVLSAFGYTYRPADKSSVLEEGSFWLSDTDGARECDASLVYAPGKIMRFDIGFIGKGNSEISKDKLSRYQSAMGNGNKMIYSNTIIIVDRLPDTAKTRIAAKEIGAHILQMSMKIWPIELAGIISQFTGKKHPLFVMSDSDAKSYLERQLSEIDLTKFM